MKKTLLVLAVAVAALAGAQSTYVKGYTKKDGTYVSGYHRTKANKSRTDNYSSKGNANPYTGKNGSVDPASPPKKRRKKFEIF